MKTDIIILAAGNSSRFQGNKLLYPYQGIPLIQYTFNALRMVDANNIIVVTQYEELSTLAKSYGYICLNNNHPEWGISYSIHLGLRKVQSDQVMFLVGDQPKLRSTTLQGMIDAADGSMILAAGYGEQAKNPVIFPRRYYEELHQLRGDVGGRAVLARYPDQVRIYEIDPDEVRDIDKKSDL